LPAESGHDYNLSAPGEISTGEVGNFQSAETGEFSTGTDSLVPMINVDLFISDDQGRLLLTWRDDEIFGAAGTSQAG
jgi:hypothetical protein